MGAPHIQVTWVHHCYSINRFVARILLLELLAKLLPSIKKSETITQTKTKKQKPHKPKRKIKLHGNEESTCRRILGQFLLLRRLPARRLACIPLHRKPSNTEKNAYRDRIDEINGNKGILKENETISSRSM